MEVYQWPATAGSITSTGTANVAEGCDPSGINDAIREMMAACARSLGSNGIGYLTGQGGTVTQATNKATDVTLNKISGQIIMNGAALASNVVASFNLNNSFIGINDTIIINQERTVSTYNYQVWAGVGSGTAEINVRNISGGTLSDAVTLNFCVIKGAAA
jgi:hypothetical protein